MRNKKNFRSSWQCNSKFDKNGECTNSGCISIPNRYYGLNYDAAPYKLERYMLERKRSKIDAAEARIELQFQISTCRSEKHILKMLRGACKKYNVPMSAFNGYNPLRRKH